MERPETHQALAAIVLVAQQPGPFARRRDLQIQVRAVGVAAWFLERPQHSLRRQFHGLSALGAPAKTPVPATET